MSRIPVVPSLLALALCAPATLAHDAETLFNRVQLEATVEREVPNDEVLVVFVARAQGKSPRELAERVNADMQWALAEVRRQQAVRADSGAYSTHPVYDAGVIQSWEVSQELRLTSGDFVAAMELAGRLQERLQVAGMQFRATREARERAADALLEEAVAAFRHRADIVGKQMEGREYRIVDMQVNTSAPVMPMPYAERAMAMAKSAAPAVEAGTSTVQVMVTGAVQYY